MSEVDSYSPPIDPAQFLARADSQAFMESVMASHELFLPNVTVAGTITVGLLAGPRVHVVDCVGARPQDHMTINPLARLDPGFMGGDVACYVNDKIEITLWLPAVTLLKNYSFGFEVLAIR